MNQIQASDNIHSPSSEMQQRPPASQDAEHRENEETLKPHFEAPYQEQASLCSRCSSIKVENLFLKSLNTTRGQWLMSLGKLGPNVELSSCSLCRLFKAVRINGNENPEGSEYDLYLTSAPTPFKHTSKSVLAVATRMEATGMDKRRKRATPPPDFRILGLPCGFIAASPTASQLDPLVHSLRARYIDAKSIDFDIIRDWTRLCNAKHTEDCSQASSSASSLKDLKLIDCEQRQIVPAPPSYQYSALSYVWGANRSGNDDRSVAGRLPIALPQTIEDALKVTKELGLRYIWIDRYCIDQDNETEKQVQIQQMDLIYQNAYISIIAAAGTDPYFGLPGVGTTPRTVQPTAWIGGRRLVSILPSPEHIIKGSKWIKRAWTYQESFSSKRRLIFTEQQVYYECQVGVAYETVDKFCESSRHQVFHPAMHDEHQPWTICSRLEEYSARELSYEADAIRAFDGIFHSFRKEAFPVFHYSGVPIMPSVIQGQTGKLTPWPRTRTEGFVAGLTWSNLAPATRRTQFPSWSWAGWTTPLRYVGIECVEGLKLEKQNGLKIFIENRDGSLSNMEKYDDVSFDQRIPDSTGKFIHVEAWTIPLDIQYMPKRTVQWINGLQPDDQWPRNVSGYFAVFKDDEETLPIPLYSLHQTYESDTVEQKSFAPNLGKGELLGIVLGRCEDVSDLDPDESIFIMIVHNEGEYFERVGHMVYTRDLHSIPSSTRKLSRYKREWQLCFELKTRRTLRLG